MWKGNVPIFRLVDERGHDWGTERLWQKHEMLIAILDPENCAQCHALETALCPDTDEGEWTRRNAGLVFVPVHAGDGVGRVVELLFEALEPLGIRPGTPTLAIADRFGRLCAAIDVHATDTDQAVDEARSWIDFVQEQCEECGVPFESMPASPLADSADDGLG